MVFTSTTEISRKGSKAFIENEYATVLHNNTDIWMIIGWKLYEKLRDSHILEDLLEDIEIEANKESLQKQIKESIASGHSDLVI